MSKLSPKRRAELSHKVIILCDLLIENLDELQADSKLSDSMRGDAESMIKHCEKLLFDAFNIKSIRSSTYLQELSKKVDTTIRKNYQKMF